jgi:hypothetical protein
MQALLFSIASGWLLVSLFAVTSILPWAIARNPAAGFRWHFSMGQAMGPIAVLHSWPAMSQGWMGRVAAPGVYAASFALLALFAQGGIGLRLRQSRGPDRRRLRRVHFGVMAILAGLIGVHVVLNSVLGSWLRS